MIQLRKRELQWLIKPKMQYTPSATFTTAIIIWSGAPNTGIKYLQLPNLQARWRSLFLLWQLGTISKLRSWRLCRIMFLPWYLSGRQNLSAMWSKLSKDLPDICICAIIRISEKRNAGAVTCGHQATISEPLETCRRTPWKDTSMIRSIMQKRTASPIHPPIKIGGLPGLPSIDKIIKNNAWICIHWYDPRN